MRTFLLLLFVAGTAQADLDSALRAAGYGEFKKAAELFPAAIAAETNPERREDAIVRLAYIEWRGFHDYDTARARLQKLDTAKAHIELARIAIDLCDFAAARAEGKKAVAMATKKRDRRRAVVTHARAVVLDPRSAADELRETVAALRAFVDEAGPRIDPARLLARAALRANDGTAALEGIDAYYHVSKFAGPPEAIAAAHAALARILPSWKGTDAERPQLAQALAGIRFFDEAAIVAPESDAAAYAAALHRIESLTNEYYRQVALGNEHENVLRDGVAKEIGNRKDDFAKRFGLYFVVGRTGSHVDMHMGHVVTDTMLAVEQYGQRAGKRFVALDAMVSNGFSEWANDGMSGDGGWGTAKEIYQVRPRYADKPLRSWERVTDAEMRAEDDRKIAEETARDRERAKEKPIQFFPGLARRLERQYLESVLAETRSRDAFLARIERDEFTSSILLHEGRHAIDIASGKKYAVWELEYRAKLSEIALAPAPRQALASVLDNDVGGEGTHSKANGKLATEIAAWMEKHRDEIAGYDATLPPMPQIDKLTDAQIKTVVRGLDPLAQG
jgi:hypothetical protein